jgi:hypothetical protein
MRRIDQSLVINEHPNIFSNITDRPLDHLSRKMPCLVMRVAWSACVDIGLVESHVDIGLVESHFNIHVFNTCKTVW